MWTPPSQAPTCLCLDRMERSRPSKKNSLQSRGGPGARSLSVLRTGQRQKVRAPGKQALPPCGPVFPFAVLWAV